MTTIEQEDQAETTSAAETDTIMRCPSIQEMTQMEAQAPGRDGAARRSLSATIPGTPGNAMAVGRRDISNATVNPEELEEEEEQREEQESAHTVTIPAIRRLNAGRSIQRRRLIGSKRRPGRWLGLHWMERQL